MDTSYLTTQVTTIIGQLHGIFDEIGVPSQERESRETELFSALSETLHNQLRLVNAEKTELTEEAHKIIRSIKQMEASLDDDKGNAQYDLDDRDLKISYPLNRCLQGLKEKYNTVSKLHRERFEQVKKLVQALESYSSHLEPSFVKITLPPTTGSSCPPIFDLSPSFVTALDNEFTKVYEEYIRRVAVIRAVSEDIIKHWAELGTPQAQTDVEIIKNYRDSPEQLGLHESDLAKLRGKHDRLVEEKKGRERRLKELKSTVEGLWDRLGVEEPDRKAFLAANRGCGLRTINEFEDELARLNELKRQNLHLFVEDARCRLQEMWDALYFSEEEMLAFTPAFSDVYSDALLSAHEAEIERLQTLKEQRAPTLNLIDKHRSLIQDRDSLAASSQDASRLLGRGVKGEKRDPTRLLREEKMRKRIAKDLPKVEAELQKVLERWEDEYGRPFLVHGDRYLDEIAASQARTAPPRSKTPSGPPTTSRSNSVKPAPPSRPASSMRGPPPPRSTTKTPTRMDTLKRNPLATSTSTMGAKSPTKVSPSKIPSRVPLSHLQHGNNSPERTQRAGQAAANTSRLMGPPRAPPPKMRDLFVPPKNETPMLGYQQDFSRPPSTLSSGSSGSVRPMSPEDVYDDRAHISASASSHSLRSLPENSAQTYHDFQPKSQHTDASYYQHYPSSNNSLPSLAGSRQISNTSNSSSAANTAASGSENWETYDDASEPEQDANDCYYAKMKGVNAQGKRMMPDGGLYATVGASQGKKFRGLRAGGMDAVGGGFAGRIVDGSEAGWTDEDAF